MAKTQSQYADDIYNDSLARAEAQKKAREQSDARTLAQINKAIDDAAGTAVSGYQQNIDTAPQQFQGYYDSNAVDEAFAREQIKNSMAEAGMSASGQNLSMQAALSLQRNRQDAAVDAEQRDYVREMQNAIDAVKANAAAQKQDQEIQMTTARNQWWDNILSSIRDSSQTAAAEMYAADQDAAAKQTQAVIDSASEYEKNRTDYAMHLMKNMDYTEDQAWAAAYAQYPSGDAKIDGYYSAYTDAVGRGLNTEYARAIAAATANGGDVVAAQRSVAENLISDINLNDISTWNDGNDTWLTQDAGSKLDATAWDANWWNRNIQKIVTKAKERINGQYPNLDNYTKNYLLGAAIGNTIEAATAERNVGIVHSALKGQVSGVALEIAKAYAGIEEDM